MRREALKGGCFALAAFGAWGLNPLYFKEIAAIPELEVLAHRIIWAVPLLAFLVYWAKSWPQVRRAVTNPKVLGILMVTTAILGLNWFLYIYTINTGQILQSSLGYYINPLVNVCLGVLILGERLNGWRLVAILLAAIGVINLAVAGDQMPWIALTLAGSFGVYGLIRKVISVASIEGLFIETALLLPLSLGYLIYLAVVGESSFINQGYRIDLLLMLAGPMTALPLIWFTSSARRLDYATLGFFQYIAPSLHFLLAVFLYDEPFGLPHMITFACIWTALAIFSIDGFRRARKAPLAQPQRVAEGG